MSESGQEQGPGGEPGGVLAATDRPIPIQVDEVQDDRTPEGFVCLGTFIGGRLVARCVVAPEAAAFFDERGLFREPVRLALSAREESPGLQCQLYALVPMPQEPSGPEEPWAASVPSSDYERVVAGEGDGDEEPEGATAAVLLGQIVRFARDRRHPDSLPLEAIDILTRIVTGEVVEVVDKVLEDLLDKPDEGPPDVA